MKCPKCNIDLESPNISHRGAEFLFLPMYCTVCKMVWMIDVETNQFIAQETVSNQTQRVPLQIPPIKDGVPVYINNREHPLFLEIGEIIDRDHCHYKLRLKSVNPKLNEVELWVPEHWVRIIPKDLRRSK